MLDEFRSAHITWDKATSRIYSTITANESDENGRKLVVQIINGGQVEALTGTTLHLYWITRDKLHDGLDVFKTVDLNKGEFELSYTTGMLSNKGVLNANLVLVDAVGRVVSERFKITVTEGIDNDAIQSQDSFSSLTKALIEVGPRVNNLTAQLAETNARVDLLNRGLGKTFATLTDLQTAYPNGDTKDHIVGADGHRYFWDGTSWADGGAYQAIELSDESVTPKKTSFMNRRNIEDCVIRTGKIYKAVSGVNRLYDDPNHFVVMVPLLFRTPFRFNYPRYDNRYARTDSNFELTGGLPYDPYSDLYGISTDIVDRSISYGYAYIGVNFDYATVPNPDSLELTYKTPTIDGPNTPRIKTEYAPTTFKDDMFVTGKNLLDNTKWTDGLSNYGASMIISMSGNRMSNIMPFEINTKYYTNITGELTATCQYLLLDENLNVLYAGLYDTTRYLNKVGISSSDANVKYVAIRVSESYYQTIKDVAWFSKDDLELYKNELEYSKIINDKYVKGLYDGAKILPQNTTHYYTSKNLTFTGDSLTAIGSTKYPLMVARALGVNAYKNHAVGGTAVETTSDAAQYVAGNNAMVSNARVNLIDENTDYLVVMAGTNGSAELGELSIGNSDVTTFIGAFNVMLSKIYYRFGAPVGYYAGINYSGIVKSTTPKDIKIIIITPPQGYGIENTILTTGKLFTRGEALKTMSRIWGTPCLDSMSMLQMNSFNNYLSFSNFANDPTHFNERTQKELANAVVGLMRSIEPIDYGTIATSSTTTL